MVSFWEKLKGKKRKTLEAKSLEEVQQEKADGVLQLDVDIYQGDSEIIIYAPMAGVDVNSLDILMEDENDVITIRGTRERPEKKEGGEEGKWLIQECEWGSFFRQIILPQEVDNSRIEAKLKKGVLILKLPLLERSEGKKRIKIQNID